MLCVAGCHGSTHARLATIFGGGVGASAGAGATAARHGTVVPPFGPVTVRHIAVVVEGAPVVGASGGQTERVNPCGVTASRSPAPTCVST